MQVFHDVKFMDLSVADHLYCWRIGGTYAHHGVLVEKGEAPDTSFVAEFGPPRDSVAHEWDSRYASIQRVTLVDFMDGSALKRVVYGRRLVEKVLKRSGSMHLANPDPPDVVVKRALSVINGEEEWGQYHLLKNNCEHFAIWCKTGQLHSNQVPFGLAKGVDTVVEALDAVKLKLEPFIPKSDSDTRGFTALGPSTV